MTQGSPINKPFHKLDDPEHDIYHCHIEIGYYRVGEHKLIKRKYCNELMIIKPSHKIGRQVYMAYCYCPTHKHKMVLGY